MKMQTSAGQLRSALGTFRGIINRRNTIPVLGTVKLQSGLLVGTDLDSEISVKIASIGPMEGDACLDWFALSALAGHIDDDVPLTLTDENSLATVAFNGSAYQLGSLPASDFPDFKGPEGERTMTTGYRAATVDVVLWRACANGVINSRTGAFHGVPTAPGQTELRL